LSDLPAKSRRQLSDLGEAPKLDSCLGSGTVPVIAIPLAFRRAAAFGSRAEDARAGCRRCGSTDLLRGALMSGAPEICLADCSEKTHYTSSGRSKEAENAG
jgi:hypothetical protein